MRRVEIHDVQEAWALIRHRVQRTGLSHSRSISEWIGAEAFLKFENEQTTGSFKIRGALNKILSLTPEEKARSIVASSAGNHAQGVAYSASAVGCKAYVVMPVHSPLVKVTATRSYGADVILHGDIYDEAYAYARELEQSKGYCFVHPYQDPQVIAGQGTLGLEILDELPDVDSIVVPIGGGGLISGVATVIKALRPKCRVYGVVPENNPGMYRLFKGLEPETGERRATIADGLAVRTPSPALYEDYVSRLVDDIVTVSEDEIAEAIVMLLERAKAVVEGAGAAAVAAAVKSKGRLGEKCGILLGGGNIDLLAIAGAIQGSLSRGDRLARLAVKSYPFSPGAVDIG